MHYIKFIMKNIVFSLIKYLYYFSFTAMIILYLFPGSLIGFLLYEDFARQPDLIANPIGTSINHALAFLYLSLLGFINYFHKKKLNDPSLPHPTYFRSPQPSQPKPILCNFFIPIVCTLKCNNL